MNDEKDDCGFTTVIKVIGGKWKVDILCQLHVAPRRFGRLRQLIPGISQKVLMQQLREMERDGIINREIYPGSPPKVVYSLTEHGAALNAGVATLCSWGEMHRRKARAASEARAPANVSGGAAA